MLLHAADPDRSGRRYGSIVDRPIDVVSRLLIAVSLLPLPLPLIDPLLSLLPLLLPLLLLLLLLLPIVLEFGT